MSMLLQKGLDYNATYSSLDYPVLDANWTGSVSFCTTYPGSPTFAKPLVITGNTFTLSLTISEILNLNDGVYSVVATMSNLPLGVEISSLEYATVTPVNISASPKCKIYGTIEKADGTPTGTPTSALANSTSGVILQSGWKGVEVRVSIPVADSDSGKIVSIETLTTTTNAAGYFEMYVIQGLTVTVSCPSFGKSVAVSTTGLTEVDISTFF